MSPRYLLDLRLLGMLAPSSLTVAERDRAVDICTGIVAMMEDLEVGHRGRAARSAAQLMLETSVPALDPELRGDLARFCELAVVRGI